jgi:ornithine decarboxylase
VTTPSALTEFLNSLRKQDPEAIFPSTPYSVFDVASATAAYDELLQALPLDEVWVAIKAAPVPALVDALNLRGAGFDIASIGEMRMCFEAGVKPEQLSFGNPIRSMPDLRLAADMGVRTWVVDTDLEVRRVAHVAPGSRVVIRIATSGEGADWPLNQRYGCTLPEAVELGRSAHRLGLHVCGISFHVGSLQRDVHAWDRPVRDAAEVWSELAREGVDGLELLNLGGGLPGPGYRHPAPSLSEFAKAITTAVDMHFADRPRLVAEPGRSLVAAAGATVTSVNGVVERGDGKVYVFLDGGLFNCGLLESLDGAVEYRIVFPEHPGPVVGQPSERGGTVQGPARTDERQSEVDPFPADDAGTTRIGHDLSQVANDEPGPDGTLVEARIQGPSCDGMDHLGAKTPYLVPKNLSPGDYLVLLDTGAYTTSYASGFNGFALAPLVVL